jgi:hypothetical protein
MQLHEFITETLSQIAKGVGDANQKLQGTSAIVNPRHVNYNTNENIRAYGWLTEKKEKLRAVHLVEFDIAVTATDGKENKGGIGVALGSIGLGTARKEEYERVAQNRISFSIPMVYPNEIEPEN